MLAIYGDESGSSHVFTIAIYIGVVEAWVKLENDWKHALENAGLKDATTGKLLPFHMADFESRFGPFAAWDDSKRKSVLRRLIEVIHDAGLFGFAARLPSALYLDNFPVNTHLPLDHKLHRVMQYMICMHALHMPLMAAARKANVKERIPIVMDQNDVAEGMVQGAMRDLYRRHSDLAKLIEIPVFRDKRRVVQLQAADIFAYEAMKEWDNRLRRSGRWLRKSAEMLSADKRHIQLDCDHGYIGRLAEEFYAYSRDNGLV